MLFLSKDSNLAYPLLEGILRYWPYANFTKQTLFLSEMLDIIEVSNDNAKLEPIIKDIFKRIVKCIASPHL